MGPAFGDVAIQGNPANAYPGYWLGDDDATGWGNNWADPSPYRNGSGEYYVPETAGLANFQFDLKMWYGNYSTFSAAQSAGAIGADTGWFKAGSMASGISLPNDSTFEYMPSVVLQPLVATPEPSTIVLVATGLFGLLAYAWRKRK